jgi:hypothetical protein
MELVGKGISYLRELGAELLSFWGVAFLIVPFVAHWAADGNLEHTVGMSVFFLAGGILSEMFRD